MASNLPALPGNYSSSSNPGFDADSRQSTPTPVRAPAADLSTRQSSTKPATIWQYARNAVSMRDSSGSGAAAGQTAAAGAASGRRKPRRHTSLDAKGGDASAGGGGGAWKAVASRRPALNGIAFLGARRVSEPGGATGASQAL